MSTGNTTLYAGNYIYENTGGGGELKFFNHAEGYIEPKNPTNYSLGFAYIYQYKDHLGNIRLSYSGSDLNGSINPNTEIIEESNYYPFGLKHKGYNDVVSANSNSVASKFGFNGIENEEALGLNLMEMEMRQYDPAIARWTSIDPVTHYSMSTYTAFDNNPVFWTDPSGADSETMEIQDFDGNTHTITEGDDYITIYSANENNEYNQNTSNTYSFKEYIKIWEKEHGVKMTASQKKTLSNGCIGITSLELGDNVGSRNEPPLDNAYSSFTTAQKAATILINDIKNNPSKYPTNARVIIFSTRFWSNSSSNFMPNKNGEVDMSKYTYKPRPSSGSSVYTNFDYGLYNKKTNMWWHANHSQPDMKVYESNLSHYSRPLLDFNRQIFSIAITTIPKI